MKRVLVIGSCGAGKSRFSKELHKITGLPLIHLDVEFWNPGWVKPEKQDWVSNVGDLIERASWIIDGNYGGTMELRLSRADTVFWLDLSRTICVYRVLKRSLNVNGRRRSDLAEGCEEKLDFEFVKFVWDFPKKHRYKIVNALKTRPDVDLFTMQTRKDVAETLRSLRKTHSMN